MADLDGVHGLTIVFCDNNGIPRSRTVPAARLEDACERGVGITTLFPVFLSNDMITFAHGPLSNASGDVRLVATPERVVPLAGQPAFAWTPGRQFLVDGERSPYCPRGVLERTVERAAAAGLDVRAGYELEWFVGNAGEELAPAHSGPVYSPHAMLAVDEFAAQLLADLRGERRPDRPAARRVRPRPDGGLDRRLRPRRRRRPADAHAADDPRRRPPPRPAGVFAPLVALAAAGNGWHIHSSVSRGGRNLLAGGDRQSGMTAEGEAWVAGLLRELPALASVAAPSMPSLLRRRPGYFASAFAFWGVQNREAALRLVPASRLVPEAAANIELKASDASGNPYLALAAVIAAGLAGIEDGLTLPDPVQDEPSAWPEDERARRGVRRLPGTADEAIAAVERSAPVRSALGDDLLGAWAAVRRGDAEVAKDMSPEDVVAAHRYRY